MPKILAIDDKADNLTALSALLANLMPGCAVITAQSGREGLEKARAELPDAILLDVKMPDMDGFETCRRLTTEESTKHIPVIMITAIKTDSESRIEGLDCGANAFLAKPIEPYELVSQVKVALRIKQAEDDLREERNSLEKTVQERTAALQEEIAERKQAEEVLKESEERYRLLFEASHDGILIADTKTKLILHVNSAMCQLLGYPAEEMRTMNVMDIHPEEALQFIIKGFEATGRGSRADIISIPFLRKDGQIVYAEINATMTILAGRECNIAICRDITERKQAEEVLRKSEQTARRLAKENELVAEIGKIISSTPSIDEVYDLFTEKVREAISFDHIVVNTINRQDYTRTARYVNSNLILDNYTGQVFSLAGTRSEQVVRTKSSLVINGKNREDMLKKFPGMSLRLGITSMMMVPLISKDEVIGVMTVHSAKVDAYSEDNLLLAERVGTQIAGAIANAQLFLERKQAEEAIIQAKDDWENTFNAVTDMITVHDMDFNIILANRAAREILGLQLLEQRPFAKCFRCYHGKEQPPTECPSCQSLRTGAPAIASIFEPHLKKHIEIRAMPRFGTDGRMIGIIHIVRDISEHRKMEEQLRQSQKMEGIGQLTGGIAHDFNNILATIMGYGEMALMKMAADDSQRSNIEHILEATDKAVHLTKDLLLFSRKQVAVKKPVYLDLILRNVQKFLLRVIGEDIEFKAIFHTEEAPILADRNHIEQVVMNLATNARDAMPRGGVLTITLDRTELDDEFVAAQGFGKAGGYAVITFADTGSGMDEETRQRIFEPFFTTKEVGKGTGLGLAVVYGIIRQHDGYIDVSSEPGLGTTFKVYLPLIESAASLEETARMGAYPTGGGETILLAEDDAALTVLTSAILEKFGYKVIAAVNGEEAVQKFREHQDSIRLLLFDMIMPKQNGKEAYDEIAQLMPDIKVIYLSGYAPDVFRRKMTIEDAAMVLPKPVSARDLLKAVRAALDYNTISRPS